MSGSLEVTWGDLSAASQKLTGGAGEITSKLTELKGAIDNLGGSWQGAASSAYATLYNDWNTGAKQLTEALEGIAKMLQGAADAYQQTEDALKQGFSG